MVDCDRLLGVLGTFFDMMGTKLATLHNLSVFRFPLDNADTV